MKTYALAEVAAAVCGEELEHPELWLLRRVRAGKVSALRISRGHYRFTQEQFDKLLECLDTSRASKPNGEPEPEPEPEPVTGRPTSASLRHRLRTSA